MADLTNAKSNCVAFARTANYISGVRCLNCRLVFLPQQELTLITRFVMFWVRGLVNGVTTTRVSFSTSFAVKESGYKKMKIYTPKYIF